MEKITLLFNFFYRVSFNDIEASIRLNIYLKPCINCTLNCMLIIFYHVEVKMVLRVLITLA